MRCINKFLGIISVILIVNFFYHNSVALSREMVGNDGSDRERNPSVFPLRKSHNLGLNSADFILTQRVIPAFSCRDMERFVFAETRNFLLYVCGRNGEPLMYVGVDKRGELGGIIVPLSNYSEDMFFAVSGNYGYILTPLVLIITEKGKVIDKQTVLRWE